MAADVLRFELAAKATEATWQLECELAGFHANRHAASQHVGGVGGAVLLNDERSGCIRAEPALGLPQARQLFSMDCAGADKKCECERTQMRHGCPLGTESLHDLDAAPGEKVASWPGSPVQGVAGLTRNANSRGSDRSPPATRTR